MNREQVIAAREAKGWSRTRAAQEASIRGVPVSGQTWGLYEKGDRPLGGTMKAAVAAAFGWHPEWWRSNGDDSAQIPPSTTVAIVELRNQYDLLAQVAEIVAANSLALDRVLALLDPDTP